MNICPKCKSLHEKSSTFCSRSCSNSRGPRTEDFKQKIRNKLKGRKKPYKEILERIFIKCIVCQIEFKIKINEPLRQTCKSKPCKVELAKIGGRASAASRKKRSKQEIELFDLCSLEFKNVLSNSIIVDGWDADIVLPDHKIAILWNGPWHYREMNMKNHSLLQVQTRDKIKTEKFTANGWKVLVFEDRYYKPVEALEKIKEMVGLVGLEPTHSRPL